LIGACARYAAKEDKAIKPLLCYNHRHYFRLFLRVDNGAGKADKMLRDMAYLQHCEKCDWRGYTAIDGFKENCPNCGSKLLWGGPLWAREFADTGFVKKVKTESRPHQKLLDLIMKEQAITTPFYDLHHLFGLKKQESRKTSEIMDRVRTQGKRACLTHFCDTGIRSEVLPPV
jgi:tRNA (guanine26-N2/guanine27-N2)-dimethyltransferase